MSLECSAWSAAFGRPHGRRGALVQSHDARVDGTGKRAWHQKQNRRRRMEHILNSKSDDLGDLAIALARMGADGENFNTNSEYHNVHSTGRVLMHHNQLRSDLRILYL